MLEYADYLRYWGSAALLNVAMIIIIDVKQYGKKQWHRQKMKNAQFQGRQETYLVNKYIKCLFGSFPCKHLTKEAGLEINEEIQSQFCNRILYQNLVAV